MILLAVSARDPQNIRMHTPNRKPGRLAAALALCTEEECEFILEFLEGYVGAGLDSDTAFVATEDGSRVGRELLQRLRAVDLIKAGVPCA